MSMPSRTALEREAGALIDLGKATVMQAAKDRDARADSDLDDEQPVVVMVGTTLGALRTAGLRRYGGYAPETTTEHVIDSPVGPIGFTTVD